MESLPIPILLVLYHPHHFFHVRLAVRHPEKSFLRHSLLKLKSHAVPYLVRQPPEYNLLSSANYPLEYWPDHPDTDTTLLFGLFQSKLPHIFPNPYV